MILAQVRRAGGIPEDLGIARDQMDNLRSRVAEGLRAPVLVLTGGVSAGKLDLVPGVLQELGVGAHFHKVAMKPGNAQNDSVSGEAKLSSILRCA